MMGQTDRLRPLQMCVTGHDHVQVGLGQVDQGALQLSNVVEDGANLITQI
jgi:hypothetical protein